MKIHAVFKKVFIFWLLLLGRQPVRENRGRILARFFRVQLQWRSLSACVGRGVGGRPVVGLARIAQAGAGVGQTFAFAVQAAVALGLGFTGVVLRVFDPDGFALLAGFLALGAFAGPGRVGQGGGANQDEASECETVNESAMV